MHTRSILLTALFCCLPIYADSVAPAFDAMPVHALVASGPSLALDFDADLPESLEDMGDGPGGAGLWDEVLDEVTIGNTAAAQPVPEPGSWVLMLSSAIGCVLRYRRSSRNTLPFTPNHS